MFISKGAWVAKMCEEGGEVGVAHTFHEVLFNCSSLKVRLLPILDLLSVDNALFYARLLHMIISISYLLLVVLFFF